MTIATKQFEGIGSRIYSADGPLPAMGAWPPAPNQAFGNVVAGDAESEFVYLMFAPTAAVTYNQGDCFAWDASYVAWPIIAPSTEYVGPGMAGTNLGTLFLGGRIGDPAADVTGNVWSFAFAAGSLYGIWVQRAGTTAVNVSVVTHQYSQPAACATLGSLATPTASTHSFGPTIGTMGWFTASVAPTACSIAAGATQITGATFLGNNTSVSQIQPRDYVSGSNVVSGTFVTDLPYATNGSITISAAPSAAVSSQTLTFTRGTLWGTIPGAGTTAPTLMSCANVPSGVFPNQTVSATGTSGTITSIVGNNANGYVVTISGAPTQELTIEQVTLTGYYEGFVRWPCTTYFV